eukprot:Protomagalhaensia_wolfi_Nauph_80__3505@NODE_3556_length_768_cov_10_270233_g2795_i0_p1_GENE_NODE_3556_length_768_cov_10_270233_g2795_i0NODE_3556_length_768_cov_10_270233_g2795_i0_p1_ORF_typecomplete_len165_score5_55_NODE_3556_length_768_cov_10_270233_g2795_i0254748
MLDGGYVLMPVDDCFPCPTTQLMSPAPEGSILGRSGLAVPQTAVVPSQGRQPLGSHCIRSRPARPVAHNGPGRRGLKGAVRAMDYYSTGVSSHIVKRLAHLEAFFGQPHHQSQTRAGGGGGHINLPNASSVMTASSTNSSAPTDSAFRLVRFCRQQTWSLAPGQ